MRPPPLTWTAPPPTYAAPATYPRGPATTYPPPPPADGPATTCAAPSPTCAALATYLAAPPLSDGPAPALTCGPAVQPSNRAARQRSRPAAEQPSRLSAQPPNSRAAEPPSRPAAEPPSRLAAEPPSCAAAELPRRRPAHNPSRRAAQLPSHPVAEPPSRRVALPREPPEPPCPGLAIDFDVWVDDLQFFLQCDRADGLSLFDLTSSASPAPAADADATVHSYWATRDAAARLAVRRHLPTSERAHFSQYKSAQTVYDALVARYSSPATAALSRLCDTRYRAALPAEFCAKNPPPPMYITLYYIVTRLPDSLRVVRDHFLSVCPTTLTVDLLEKALLAAEKSILAVGASRGDPRTPFFEGRSVRRLPQVGDFALVEARGAGALEELAGAVEAAVEAAEGVGVVVGVVTGAEMSVAAVEAEAAAAAVGVEVVEVVEVVEAVVEEEEEEDVARRRGVAPVVASASSSSAVRRPCPLSSSVSGTLHANEE
ncbi:unnamed protein product [Closterium sp. NIES-64]|nr:unnamed protein product [Closterium sp. NIES-64]